ncbi:bacteriocin-protection protein, YdeI/OmpD-associated family [bacterium]|nr:MAG: bacteriocin-protection protein, YdeI/OmpD-associated family [bacterium]
MPHDAECEIRPFADAASWERWLEENQGLKQGTWLKIAKKGSGIPTVSYDEALDVALCYGWIDGQKKTYEGEFFMQRFTPRRPKSLWSKRNVAKALGLIDSGRMRPAGLSEVELARSDGRWQAAYDSPKDMVLPEDFLSALEKNERAKAFFDTLNKSSRYTIAFRLHNAGTPETRARRFTALLGQLERGEAIR